MGGAEKSLISLLYELNPEKYDIDLFLFQHQGKWLSKLPAYVNLLPIPQKYKYFDSSFLETMVENFKKGNLRLMLDRIRFTINNTSQKPPAVKEQINWKFIKNHIEPLQQKYDAAFGFLEKTPNYFVIDKVVAKKKILAVMTDYRALEMDRNIDVPYFQKADAITVLSGESKATLEEVFPEFSNKILLLENMISEKEILSAAQEEINDFPQNEFTIVSVGRLDPVKLHEQGVEVMKELKHRNLKFKWLVIGEGPLKNKVEQRISEYQLQNEILLLGTRENPYPYIKKADVFLHLSKFEGYGIAIAEARILKKCIVLNDFTTASSHIKNGFDGVITSLNPVEIAAEIEKLMLDKNLRKKYEQNVSFDKDFAQKILKKIENIVKN